jgi:uncharacterized protein (DUF2249 family)
MTASAATIDVRHLVPRDRHTLIFSTFHGLPQGAALELVNDHDPRPLYSQFDEHFPGRFSWEYLERGPAVWRVRIGKAAGDDCCGGCTCGGG